MQRWALTNIRKEVLEQFVDPRWADLAVLDARFSGVLTVVSANTNWSIVSVRTDADRRDLVLEAASSRPVWSVHALQDVLPNVSAQDIGTCLSQSADWVLKCTSKHGKRWVNCELLGPWLEAAGRIKLSEAASQLDLAPRTLANLVRSLDGRTVTSNGFISKKRGVR